MKYAVQVNYRTHRGNASSRTFVVEANSEPEAVEIANGKARKHPNVQSIVGGDVVEVFSPAPTDWGKELAKIQDLREKAKEYLSQMSEKYGPIAIENSLVIEIAAEVQKAIAGGDWK